MFRYGKRKAGFLLLILIAAMAMSVDGITASAESAGARYGETYYASAETDDTAADSDTTADESTGTEEEATAEDADDTEAEDADTSAVPVLFIDGLTVYIDVETDGKWSSVQGSILFDSSLEVADYGTVEDVVLAADDQSKLSMPVSNVTDDGEYIFAGIFTNIMDDTDGITYSGHVFFITFASLEEPVTVVLQDSDGNTLEVRTVDGESTDVEESSDVEDSEGEEDSSEESSGSSSDGGKVRKAGGSMQRIAFILRVVATAMGVVLVLVVAVLIVSFRKNRKKK